MIFVFDFSVFSVFSVFTGSVSFVFWEVFLVLMINLVGTVCVPFCFFNFPPKSVAITCDIICLNWSVLTVISNVSR